MNTKEEGTPAFPVRMDGPCKWFGLEANQHQSLQFHGMTLRDYFMAHAPSIPQDWFIPVMPPCPAVPSIKSVPEGDLRLELELYYSDACDAESGEAMQWVWNRTHQESLQAEWQVDFRKQRYVQWPAAWADLMLEQRKC